LGKEPSDEFLRDLGREMAARHQDPEAAFEANLDTPLKVIEELRGAFASSEKTKNQDLRRGMFPRGRGGAARVRV
jgi:hypothetical protein